MGSQLDCVNMPPIVSFSPTRRSNQSEKEGERLVAGTEIGVVGIWIVRGNDGEKKAGRVQLSGL